MRELEVLRVYSTSRMLRAWGLGAPRHRAAPKGSWGWSVGIEYRNWETFPERLCTRALRPSRAFMAYVFLCTTEVVSVAILESLLPFLLTGSERPSLQELPGVCNRIVVLKVVGRVDGRQKSRPVVAARKAARQIDRLFFLFAAT